MAKTLDQYLGSVEDLSFYDPGRVLEQAINQLPPSQRNEIEGWAAYGVAAMRQAWAALPPDVRGQVMSGLNDVIERIVDGTIGTAAGVIADVGKQLGDVLDAIPILAAVVEFLKLLVGTIHGSAKKFKELNYANSLVDEKKAQTRMFAQELSNPRKWAVSVIRVYNYPRFFTPSNRKNDVRWRLEPCMTPCLGPDAKLWDQDLLAPHGYGGRDCRPGTPIKNPVDYPDIEPTDGVEMDPCVSYMAVSCLFFPYWAPNHPARALNVYGDPYPDSAHFHETPPNPNGFLVAAQQALLADFRSNFQVRGSSLEEVYNRFRTWYLQLHLDAGERPRQVNSEGRLSGDETFGYDAEYDAAHEHSQEKRFYMRSDGLIESYGQRADPASAGFRAPENLLSSNLAVTLAQYNTVVSQTKAFFTARRRFLENRLAMQALRSEGDLGLYDPAIRSVILAQAAAPAVLIDGVEISKPGRAPLRDLSRGAEAVVDAAQAAMRGDLKLEAPKRGRLTKPKRKALG